MNAYNGIIGKRAVVSMRTMITALLGGAMLFATIAVMVGYPRVAIANVAVLPLAIFNAWFAHTGIMRSNTTTLRVIVRTLLRNVLSASAMVIGWLFGEDVLFGVFLVVVLESGIYGVTSFYKEISAMRGAHRGK